MSRHEADPVHETLKMHFQPRYEAARQSAEATRTGQRGQQRGNPEPRRFDRQRVYNVVDQTIDLAGMARRSARELATGVAGMVRSVRSTPYQPPVSPAAPSVQAPAASAIVLPPVSPGGVTRSDLELENTSRNFVDHLRLVCAALVTSGAARIPGDHLQIQDDEFDLGPGERRVVHLTLRVPADARPGTYVGLVEADGRPDIHALVRVSVG